MDEDFEFYQVYFHYNTICRVDKDERDRILQHVKDGDKLIRITDITQAQIDVVTSNIMMIALSNKEIRNSDRDHDKILRTEQKTWKEYNSEWDDEDEE